MFIERVESDDEQSNEQSNEQIPVAGTEPLAPEDTADTTPNVKSEAEPVTLQADSRTTEVDLTVPTPVKKTPSAKEVEKPKQRGSKWSWRGKSKTKDEKQTKRELAKTKSDAAKTKREVDEANSAAEKARQDARLAKAEADKARLDAENTKLEAQKRIAEAERAKEKAEKAASPEGNTATTKRALHRTPMFWTSLAAATVMALAAGWLARPLIGTVFENGSTPVANQPTQNAQDVPQTAEQVPAIASDTTAVEETTEPIAVPEAVSSPPLPAPVQQQPTADEDIEAIIPPPTLSGAVREAGSESPLAGATVTLVGTETTTTTDASGAYFFEGLPAGSLSIAVELDGFLPSSGTIVTEAGGNSVLNLELRGPPDALQADEELDDGQWTVTDLAEATLVLGRPVAVIDDLWIESIARPSSGTRPRVRVAQLTDTGKRIVMVVSRSGPAIVAAVPRVTSLRIIPPSEAYPITTGTASFGGFLVTAKATMAAESLRALLQRLTERSSRQ